jgi:protein TonB
MKLLIKLLYFSIIILPSFAEAQCDSLKPYFSDKPMLITVVEEMPQFPGGDEARIAFLKENIKLPANWPQDSITGKVFVTFLVDLEGNIKYPCILRGLDPILDSIALATIKKMPKWIPAKQRGVPMRELFNLPINFGQHQKERK